MSQYLLPEQIDRELPQPVYQQIYEQLKRGRTALQMLLKSSKEICKIKMQLVLHTEKLRK